MGETAVAYQLIVNPKSGSCPAVSTVIRLRDTLRQRGHEAHAELTRSLPHAAELAQDAARHGRHVIVAGGDGTVRCVLGALAGSSLPILILPAGCENLLAQQLGLDGSLPTMLACLDRPHPRTMDLGIVNGQHFMAVVGVGFDAQVVRRIHRSRTGHISHFDYIWPICRTFWEYGFPHLTVHADGKLVCDEPALVFIGNISRYAVGLPVLPQADPSDGKLSITVYRYRRRRELLAHALRTICRRADRSPRVSRHVCTHITIASPDPDVPVQTDGDPGPGLPLTIDILPAAVRVLTPPPPPGQAFHPPLRRYHLRQLLCR